jgi:hypothetical protein
MKKLVFICAIEVYNGLNIFCSGETCDNSTLAVSGGRMPMTIFSSVYSAKRESVYAPQYDLLSLRILDFMTQYQVKRSTL